jgi:hypothetical protein
MSAFLKSPALSMIRTPSFDAGQVVGAAAEEVRRHVHDVLRVSGRFVGELEAVHLCCADENPT